MTNHGGGVLPLANDLAVSGEGPRARWLQVTMGAAMPLGGTSARLAMVACRRGSARNHRGTSSAQARGWAAAALTGMPEPRTVQSAWLLTHRGAEARSPHEARTALRTGT